VLTHVLKVSSNEMFMRVRKKVGCSFEEEGNTRIFEEVEEDCDSPI
jgi:hypothetical protein